MKLTTVQFKSQHNISDRKFARIRDKIEKEVGRQVVERFDSNTWYILEPDLFLAAIGKPVIGEEPSTAITTYVVEDVMMQPRLSGSYELNTQMRQYNTAALEVATVTALNVIEQSTQDLMQVMVQKGHESGRVLGKVYKQAQADALAVEIAEGSNSVSQKVK